MNLDKCLSCSAKILILIYTFFYNDIGNEDGDEHYNDNNINNFSVGSNTLKLWTSDHQKSSLSVTEATH